MKSVPIFTNPTIHTLTQYELGHIFTNPTIHTLTRQTRSYIHQSNHTYVDTTWTRSYIHQSNHTYVDTIWTRSYIHQSNHTFNLKRYELCPATNPLQLCMHWLICYDRKIENEDSSWMSIAVIVWINIQLYCWTTNISFVEGRVAVLVEEYSNHHGGGLPTHCRVNEKLIQVRTGGSHHWRFAFTTGHSIPYIRWCIFSLETPLGLPYKSFQLPSNISRMSMFWESIHVDFNISEIRNLSETELYCGMQDTIQDGFWNCCILKVIVAICY